MKVLIVKKNDPATRANIQRAIVSALPSIQVTQLDEALRLSGIDAIVLSKGPFDLVLHHCGDTNGEYGNFIKEYRNSFSPHDCQFILFSGNSRRVATADAMCLGDPAVCAVTQDQIQSNLALFMSDWISKSQITAFSELPPWHILRGQTSEAALQFITACEVFFLSGWTCPLERFRSSFENEILGKLSSGKSNWESKEETTRLRHQYAVHSAQFDDTGKCIFGSFDDAFRKLQSAKGNNVAFGQELNNIRSILLEHNDLIEALRPLALWSTEPKSHYIAPIHNALATRADENILRARVGFFWWRDLLADLAMVFNLPSLSLPFTVQFEAIQQGVEALKDLEVPVQLTFAAVNTLRDRVEGLVNALQYIAIARETAIEGIA